MENNRRVWKFVWPLPADRVEFQMPRDAEILCCHEQHGGLCIWARVVEGREREPRRFVVCGTGHPAPDFEHRFVGTAFLDGGSLVLHVFEGPRTTEPSGRA